jgi:hypothetical protein
VGAMKHDGFIPSTSWAGAKSCPYCARYSEDGHARSCSWSMMRAEVRRLRRFVRACTTYDCACGDGDICVGCMARQVLKR